MPGWVAVIDEGGQILTASPGAESLAQIVPGGVPVGHVLDIKDIRGKKYTIAAYPVRETRWFVVAAVAWEGEVGVGVGVGVDVEPGGAAEEVWLGLTFRICSVSGRICWFMR